MPKILSPAEKLTQQKQLIYRPIDALKPNPRNPRTHKKSQMRKLKRCIQEIGFWGVIIIDAQGIIVAGSAKWLAAKELGLTEVPTICIEGVTEDQIRAFMLADNRIALEAGWDAEILTLELQHLISIPDFDVSLAGFEVAEIDLFLDGCPAKPDPADAFPPPATEVISRSGDCWLLGEHRLLCGDACDPASYSTLCGGHRASVVFSDPPYNVRIDGHASGNGKVRHPEFAMASGEMTEGEFIEFLTTCLGHLATSSVDGAVHFITMDWAHAWELLNAGRKVYGSLLNLCVWNKDRAGMGSFYRGQHELVFAFKVGKAAPRNNVQLGKWGRNRTNVWNYPSASTTSQKPGEENLLAMHPTVKPIALIADALLDCSARGEIVLDSFLGSGSTLLAAERVGRICYGMEMESRYVDLAIRRWQQLTGEHAHHAVTGNRFDSEMSCHGR